MNSIFKLITNQQIPETANALVPVIGYEPWSLRALESIKSSIVNGVPTLIRVHSAADYTKFAVLLRSIYNQAFRYYNN